MSEKATASLLPDACLRSELPCDEELPCAGRYPHRCLAASIPLWSQPLDKVRCCMRCCVRYWMRTLRLGRNEAHWASFARRRGRRERSDDWGTARLQSHATSGQVLLGEMDAALLAHGNVLYSRRGKYAQLSLRPPPHSLGGKPRSRQTMRALLAELPGGSVLLLHSNEAEHAGVLLEVLRNVTALVPPRVAVSLVSRDDRPMPSEHMLRRWRGVRASWRRAGLTPPRWFVQNVAAAAELARPGAEGIHPFPIGVHNPNQLRAFLAHVRPRGLEAQVAQRRTLLMCCCMQASVPERQRALAALARNGFACSAAADQAPSHAVLREAMRSAAAAPSGDETEAVATERLRTWPYYATALHSRFVASPAGHGRDC